MTIDRRTFIAAGLSLAAFPTHTIAQAQTLTDELPPIGMGTWLTFNIDPDGEAMASRQMVLENFFEAGGGMIDSSPMYGRAEDVVGRLLEKLDHSKINFSATKIWTPLKSLGPVQLKNSGKLWRTGDKPLDLVYVHNLLNWEAHLPMLREAKEDGKIRYIGLTTSHGSRHAEMERLIKSEPIDAVQFTYNILDREAEERLLPAAQDAGLAVIINRPFQGGQLLKKFAKHPLPEWAAEIDVTNWAEFFLKFIISHPGVTTAIPATSHPIHMLENMGAGLGAMPDSAMRQRMIAYVEDS